MICTFPKGSFDRFTVEEEKRSTSYQKKTVPHHLSRILLIYI